MTTAPQHLLVLGLFSWVKCSMSARVINVRLMHLLCLRFSLLPLKSSTGFLTVCRNLLGHHDPSQIVKSCLTMPWASLPSACGCILSGPFCLLMSTYLNGLNQILYTTDKESILARGWLPSQNFLLVSHS